MRRSRPCRVDGYSPEEQSALSGIPASNQWLEDRHIRAFKISFHYPASVRKVIIDNVRLLPPFNCDAIAERNGGSRMDVVNTRSPKFNVLPKGAST